MRTATFLFYSNYESHPQRSERLENLILNDAGVNNIEALNKKINAAITSQIVVFAVVFAVVDT